MWGHIYHNVTQGTASPASTESLIHQTLDELLMSPWLQLPLGTLSPCTARVISHHNLRISVIFTKFAEMLDKGLSQTAAKITSDIKLDLQALGSRIETKVDVTGQPKYGPHPRPAQST